MPGQGPWTTRQAAGSLIVTIKCTSLDRQNVQVVFAQRQGRWCRWWGQRGRRNLRVSAQSLGRPASDYKRHQWDGPPKDVPDGHPRPGLPAPVQTDHLSRWGILQKRNVSQCLLRIWLFFLKYVRQKTTLSRSYLKDRLFLDSFPFTQGSSQCLLFQLCSSSVFLVKGYYRIYLAS